ncbi:leucine zipper putative tumor suppressor 2 homolog [Sardina pilchardus]|uniref:leucine zipper putative tumor suppressor 2 homolog n=1 Tax=Sardina pilchardus TaxID=27697 RepID=UPI002E0F0728
MALVQPPPAVPSDHRRPVTAPSPPPPDANAAMGSVSSLIASRTAFPSRPGPEVTGVSARHHRRPTHAATGRYHPQDITHEPLLGVVSGGAGGKRQPLVASGQTHRHRTYLSDDFPGEDWEERHVAPAPPSPGNDMEEVMGRPARSGSDGAPPRLVPVSGKLERNIEKAIIRPTAFKPVVPKSRSNMQYLSPRLGGALSNSQGNLNLLAPGPSELAPSAACSERRSSYSGSRNGLMTQSCSISLSDSGRNSLSSLPTYNSAGGGGAYSPGQSDASGAPMSDPVKLTSMPPPPPPPPISHGHTSSDSGRSSSSKSTGSLTGMGVRSGVGGGGGGVPMSDCGSCGRSPSQAEAYEQLVRDLEDKLRERDLELQELRENLDENEVAICQVYEEKQKRCELEMEELRQSCASRMQQASQKAQRSQQLLQLQVFQLQTEKKKLQEDFGHLLQEREQLDERCAKYEREKTQLGPRLEETKWEVCQKSGEISLLKQQLKDLQAELAQRVGEVMTLRGQLRETRAEREAGQAQLQEALASARTRQLELEVCENELQRRKSEAELLRQKVARLEEELATLKEAQQEAEEEARRAAGAAAGAVAGATGEAWQQQQASECLRAELTSERQRQSDQVSAFEEERRSWEEEKEKVIRYQKQLQQNYVQMYRRNRQLEGALRDLSMELEARELDDEDDGGSGNEINFDDVTATEI